MKVQINRKFVEANTTIQLHKETILFTPPIDEDYWLFRVPLTDKQAIVGFPKFWTIGIGFQVEEYDWNTNLPYTSDAETIYKHIEDNKGDDTISEEACISAIQAIQKQAKLWEQAQQQ